VFEDEEHIKRFLTLIDEYLNLNIDLDEEEDGTELETDQSADQSQPKMIGG
jgi:hypothetical protein